MSYIAFAWLTSIAYGIGSIVGKISTKYHIANPWLYNMTWTVLTILFTLPFALAGGVGLPQDWGSMILLGLSSAASGTSFVLAFYALDLSILSPLYSLRTPLVALGGVLLFRETLSLFQWILIGVVFVGGMFVNLDERMSLRSFWNKKTLLAFLAIVTSALFNTAVKHASLTNGYWEVSLWSNILTLILILPTVPLFYRDLRKTPLIRYHGLALSTVLFTAGLLFSVKALGENVSISIAIMSLPLSMIFAMALSVVAPKLLEKHPFKVYAVRFVAASVMFAAALGLSR